MYRGELLAVVKLVDVVSVLDVESLRAAAGRLAVASDDDEAWRVVEALQKVAVLDPAGSGCGVVGAGNTGQADGRGQRGVLAHGWRGGGVVTMSLEQAVELTGRPLDWVLEHADIDGTRYEAANGKWFDVMRQLDPAGVVGRNSPQRQGSLSSTAHGSRSRPRCGEIGADALLLAGRLAPGIGDRR